ncbi:MAG: GtrA family protein [Pseudomonadota bacterium]
MVTAARLITTARARWRTFDAAIQNRHGVSAARHVVGLAAAGLLALAVDLAVLVALEALGVHPLAGRVVSIALAMLVSWTINRTVSFAVKAPPTINEFARFAAVSWTAQAVNYLVFSVLLIALPATPPTIAVLAGCAVSIFVAYAGFTRAVFAPRTPALQHKAALPHDGSSPVDDRHRRS